MREVEATEAEKITFFMYEEINAFRLATENVGISRQNIENMFYNNAAKLFNI